MISYTFNTCFFRDTSLFCEEIKRIEKTLKILVFAYFFTNLKKITNHKKIIWITIKKNLSNWDIKSLINIAFFFLNARIYDIRLSLHIIEYRPGNPKSIVVPYNIRI